MNAITEKCNDTHVDRKVHKLHHDLINFLIRLILYILQMLKPSSKTIELQNKIHKFYDYILLLTSSRMNFSNGIKCDVERVEKCLWV